MREGSSRRHSAAVLAARRAVAVVASTCLLASCAGAGPGGRGAEPVHTDAPSAAGTSAPSAPATRPTEQAVPTTQDAAALARRLDRAIATLRDPNATAADVQHAGEFQQLAVRALASATETFRRTVMAALRPEAARRTRGDVRAARLLTVITEPRRRFPPWRIIAPPPAAVLLGYYREAQRRTGVPWTYLAAIHLVETRMGRIRGPSTAGALGPMQFMPSTWARFGVGGDINDPRDAIRAAARLLRAYGAPRDMAAALWHYNPSSRYVGAVSEYARTMQRSGSAYRGYWQWRVLYHLRRGTYVLPIGYPKVRPVRLAGG